MNKIERLLFTFLSIIIATTSFADIPAGEYAIEITAPTNGTVVVSNPANAVSSLPGTTITLTVTPSSGYYLNKLTVTPYGEGANARQQTRATDGPTMLSVIPITTNANGTYSFIMPNKKVVISAEFGACASISTATVTLNEFSHDYDWMSHTPSISSVIVNTIQLFEGKDYTVSSLKDVIPANKTENDPEAWDNGITSITNAGTRKIRLTGIGKYSGTRDVNYVINPRSIVDAKINLSKTSFIYLKNTKQIAEITGGVYLNGQEIIQNATNGYTDVKYYVGDYSSTSLPTAGASIFTSATIESKNVGTYTISITGVGNFTGTAKTTYQITARDISTCTVSGTTSFTYNNSIQYPDQTSLIVSDGSGNLENSDYTITYKTGETTWATAATSKEIGTYYMKLTGAGQNYTGSVEVPYFINSIGAKISKVGTVDYTTTTTAVYETPYTGNKITPDIEVKDGSTKLTQGTHYSVDFYNNINVGVATVTVTGISPYNFHTSKEFHITPKELTADMVTLSGYTAKINSNDASNNCFKYNGNIQKPTVTIADGTALKSSDYIITNNGGTNKGTYNVIVEGQNNYKTTTSISIPYEIIQNSLSGGSITLSANSAVYTGSQIKPDVLLVKTSDDVIASATDYDVTYTNNINQGTATVKVKAKHTGTEGNETYTGNFKDYATKTFTIDRKPVSNLIITLDATSFSYDGTVKTPTVTVKDGGILTAGDHPTTLTENTHYSLSYNGATTPSSTAVGSYTVTITGIGNYTGSVDKTYVINYGTSDSEFIVTVLGTHTYTGNKITPAGTNDGTATEGVLVKRKVGTNPDSYPILDPATDYTLTYSNNTNAGTATVIATGENNYQFVQTAEFTIDKQSVNVAGTSISISYPSSATSLTYNGSPQTPIVSVTDANSRVMTEGTDFTVNEGATNAGNHTVTITGIGNYKDSKISTNTYTISTLDITGATITLASSNYFFDNTEKKPSVEQVKKGSVIVPASDYDVVYSNNTNKGTATVTVKPKTSGTINLSATTNPSTTFEINARALTESMVTLPYPSVQYDGTAKIPVPTVSDIPSGKDASIITTADYDVTYSDNTNVGTATVTVTAKRNYSGVVKKTFKIVEKDASGIFTVALADGAPTTFTYNGSPHTPAVKVTKTGTTTVLNLGTDYSVDYSDNTNAGTAKITVTGKGNYQGTVVFQFTINPKPITALASTDITLSATSYNYDGSDHKPTVTVKDGTTKTLVENIDYTLTYPTDLRSQGSKTITISGIGNYGGSVNKTYTINKIDLTTATIDLPALSYVYNRAEQKPVPVVRVGTLVISTNDYDIRWDNDNDATNTADVTNIGTKTVYITGKNNCEGATSINYTITAKTLISSMVTLTYTEMTYTGSDLNPGITVKDGEATLTNDTEYTVTLTNNTNVGTATVTVQGIGNYTGTVQKTFSIQTTASGAFTISDIAAYTFDNTEHKPTPTVSKGGTDLTLDKDYTLSYTNNKNAGTATVTVTGIGGYAGSNGSKTFTINPKTLTAAMVSLSNFTVTVDANHDTRGYTFNGSNQKPNVTITDAAAKITADDYDIINAGGTNVGNYTVTVTGKGNYTTGGSPISIPYRIYQRDLSASTVILNQLASYIYDGSDKEPGVKQVTFGSEVVASTDYTVVHSNNKNAGTATVTVTGQNNHTGTMTATFTIQKKALANNMITFDQETFNYDGSNKAPTVTMQDMSGSNNIIQASDCDISIPTSSAVGTYTVNVSAKETGNYSGSASRQYSIIPEGAAAFDIAWTGGSAPSPTYDGNAQEPAVTVTNHSTNTALNASDYDIAYSNNKNAGTATVTVTGKANYSGTKTLYFTINKKPMTDAMLTLTGGPFTYNGSVQKPTATVSDGACPITTNDYVINNEGNINAGTHTVTATATDTGNYSGSSSKTYTISPYALTTENTTITLNQTSLVYDGTAKTPEVQLVKVGSDLVVPTYTTVYANNTNAAAATAATAPQVTVTGTGNFTGSAVKKFTITPKTVTSDMLSFDKEFFTYNGSLQKPTVTVKDGNNPMTETIDYTLTNDGGTNLGTYYVYIDGNGNYQGRASRAFNIVTEGASMFSVEDIASVTFDGTYQEPTVTVKDNTNSPGTPLTKNTHYTITYVNNRNAGTASVILTGIGSYAGTITKNFTINPKPLTADMVSVSETSFTYNELLQKPTVTISDGTIMTDNDYNVTNNGAINVGNYTITVTGKGNYTGTINKNYTIGKKNITGAVVTLYELQSYVYDGAEKKPGVREVTIGTMVVPTMSYSVEYSNNKNVGTATVTVTASNNFEGTASQTFAITKRPVTSYMITLSEENFTFNNSLHKPNVTVSDVVNNTNIITADDYTLTNAGGTAVGSYNVTIEGMGNYTGSASKPYSIIPQGASSFTIGAISDVEYNGAEQEPTVTVNDGTKVLEKNTDYSITYTNNKNVGTATVTVTGLGNYSGTKTASFKITAKPLTNDMVVLSAKSFVFNTLQQKPTVTVSDGTIMTDNDYTITNNGGIGCGTYHVIVTGKGNYSGQIDKTFDITQLDISNASVTLYELQSYAYDGKAKKPGVREVMVGSVTVPTTGYTISYGENINAGTATVTVTGQGDFKGSKTVNFTIEKKAVTDNMIILSNLEYTYNGNVQKPEVSVKDGETTLTLDTDYTLDNNGGVNAGVYDVKITGKGNYTGSAFKSFYINTREAGNFVVTLSEESMVYSGSELKPEVTVEDGGNALTAGKDYTVTYNDNINVGVATITVRGMGEYDGIKNKTFIIKPKEIKAEMVTLSSSGFTYNGMQQRPVVTVADGTFLTSNDYVVTNEGGINAGSYPVKVTGRNNYTGTVETSFSIGALDLAEAKVILYDLANYEYDGSPKNPGVREVAVGTMVVPTSSYTTEISANVNVGTVTVTVTGTGNFAGSASTTFEILQKPITTSMITLTPDIFYYNGSTQKPAVTVKHGKLTLREGTDFTLTNNGGRNAGTYEVNVKGMGNYTDEASASYNILTSEVTIFEITLETEKYVYDGTAREPAVTVKEGERVLTAVTDYTVKYANNVNAGTATVAVIGVGDYKGSQMKEFIIEPKPMTEDMVSLDKTTFTYNEEKQKPVVTVSDGDIMTEADYTITNEGGTEVGAYEVVVKGKNNYNGTITKKYNIVRSEMPVDPKPGEEQPGDAKINVSPTEEGSNEVKVSSITTSETGDASVTIPETCTINGQTYTVTGIADGAFASASNLKDIYLPETEKPLTIGKNAIPAQANVHVPLALLAEYALMPTMAESFRNGKVMSTVKAKNRYWTFASGVDVYVPDGLDVYIAREHNGSSVSIIQLTDNELAVGGQRVIKANNGVLINSSGNDTEYVFVACAKRMTSGTAVSTDDNKDYGLRNCLIPVIVATHFEAGNYYFMKDNEFYRIKDESEDIKVPAGKAVLYMKSANASARVRLINGTTDINSENIAEDEGEWYTLEGMKLEGRPTKEGIYIHNKKKVYIRKYEK